MSSILSTNKQLHWTQRMALVRHNLHTASRSGDFSFFKTLQAAGLMDGTNHAATLSASMGDDADILLAAIDNLNVGLAYVHQDAFKNVYDRLKSNMCDESQDEHKSKLYVDITMQKNMADMAIDKMTSSAVALINQQPEHVQNEAANVWTTGVTIIADSMETALRQLDSLEDKMDDFIRLEESWNTVKAGVVCSVSALKGVFSLMEPANLQNQDKTIAGRSASIASASGAMFRRLSSAFTSPSPAASRNASVASTTSNPSSHGSGSNAAATNLTNFARNGSVGSFTAPVYRTPNYVRNSVSNGCPTSMPPMSYFESHKLSPVPPTPAQEELADPFDTSLPPIPTLPENVAILTSQMVN